MQYNMNKLIFFLFILFYHIGNSQTIKICQLPQTATGTLNDFLIKEDSTCVNGTRKISVNDFINHFIDKSFEGETCAIVVGTLEKLFFLEFSNKYKIISLFKVCELIKNFIEITNIIKQKNELYNDENN